MKIQLMNKLLFYLKLSLKRKIYMYRLYLYFIELNMTTSFKYFETNMKQKKTILSPNRNKIVLAVH